MGFLSASTSFTRYRLAGELPPTLLAEAPDRLKKFAFRDIDRSADERSFGWVCFDHFLDVSWKTAPPEKGSYFTFTLRLDTRRISPAVLKKHLILALDEHKTRMAEAGRRSISKDERQEIGERVRLSLLAKTLPVPAVFEIIWNTQTDMVYLGSVNSKIREMFEELFSMTFGLGLEPMDPLTMAGIVLGPTRKRALDTYQPAVFAKTGSRQEETR